MSKRQARIGGKLRRGVLVGGARLRGRNAYVGVSSVVAGIMGEGRKQEGIDKKLKECVYVQPVDVMYVLYVTTGERGEIFIVGVWISTADLFPHTSASPISKLQFL
jgi:hypothetical protein